MDSNQYFPVSRRQFLAAISALTFSLHAHAQAPADATYPNKPIRLIVGFPPGTATDTVARVVAQYLNEVKKWNVVVENRPGVSGSLAAAEVASAPADGYTLLLSAAGPMATNPNLNPNVKYRTERDFTPLALIADISYVIVVGSQSPVKSIHDLVALAKSKSDKLNYGSVGVGSTQHLIGSTFLRRVDGTMTHIPYKGSVEMLNGAVAGDLAFYVDTAVAAAPQIASGRLRPLGVTSMRRVSNLPDLATLDQQGLTGFDMPNWLLLAGPANMPSQVVKTINHEINSMFAINEVRVRLSGLGTEPRGDMDTEKLRAFIMDELKKWKQALEVSGALQQK